MRKKFKRSILLTTALCVGFLDGIEHPSSANATDITGITGVNGVYNINPAKVSGNTGFRNYQNFNLDKGDTANLKFDNIQHFVNLVDNKININGVVNTMQGNNFYNGHAIFVSPNGMVIGASGVLNVGSLSVLTPTTDKYNEYKNGITTTDNLTDYIYDSDKYKALITNSQGDIVVNGKIIAREGVNLYGSNITIAKDKTAKKNNTAGIIAGYKGTNNKFDLTAAEQLFNSIVSNNAKNANAIEIDDKGDIKLVAQKTVEIKPKEKETGKVDKDGKKETVKEGTTTKEDLQKSVETVVKIDDAVIAGHDIKVEANATHKIETTIDKVDSALSLESILDPLSLIGAKLNEHFLGTRAKTTIDVINSYISSTNDTSLKTNAVSEFKITTPDDKSASEFVYALGTQTTSQININNSTILAVGAFSANALSGNSSSLKITNNVLYEKKKEDKPQEDEPKTEQKQNNDASNGDKEKKDDDDKNKGKLFLLINQTTKASTATKIDNSKVTANKISVTSVNSNSDSINLKNKATTKDKTGVAIGTLVKNEQVDTEALVSGGSVFTLTGEDKEISIISQNLNIASNEASLKIEDGKEEKKEDDKTGKVQQNEENPSNTEISEKPESPTKTVDDKEGEKLDNLVDGVQKQMANSTSGEASKDNNGKDVSKNIKKDDTEAAKDPNHSQLGGVLIVNKSNVNTKATFDNSSVINAKSTNIETNTVDFTKNSVEAETSGKTNFSAGLGVIVNLQEDKSLAKVLNNSTINSDGVVVNSTTELPMNAGKLVIDVKLPGLDKIQAFELDIDSSGDNSWDFNPVTPWDKMKDAYKEAKDDKIDAAIKAIKGEDDTGLNFSDFFNNTAKASASSESTGVAGSFVYNSIDTDTQSVVENSVINATTDNVDINATNSVISYNGAGALDYIVSLINEKTGAGDDADPPVEGSVGIGGSVLVNVTDNKASAIIDNSKIIAESSDINVNSANEQAYLSVSMIGSKTEKVAVDGAVNVQTIEGTTTSAVKNSSELSGKNINVNAGYGKIKTAKKNDDYEPEIDDESGLISFNDERDVNDKISNITLGGVLAQQSTKSSDESHTGVSVGASVNVTTLDRTVKATVENSTVVAEESANVNSKNLFQSIDVAIAGAFAGGVSTDKKKQENANKGETDKDKTNGAQKLDNFGGWMDKTDKASGENSTFQNESNDNKKDTQNASGSDIANGISDDSTKNALGSTNSKVVTQKRDVLDKDGNPKKDSEGNKIQEDVEVVYKPDENGVYKDDKGNSLKDDKGNDVKVDSDTSKDDLANNIKKKSEDPGSTDNKKSPNSSTSAGNFSVAVAGAVNVNVDESTVSSNVSNSNITVKKDLNVTSNQDNKMVNVAGGITSSDGTVGAGAGVNVNNFDETTKAIISDSTVNANGSDVKVYAKDADWVVDVAAGLGIAKDSQKQGEDSVKAAVGGSFNVNVAEATTASEINNSTINNAKDVNVKADSFMEAYKGAGALTVNKTKGTSIAAGIATNVNVLKETTDAKISGGKIEAENLSVITNDTDAQTMSILSAAAAGDVIVGGSSSAYSFNGAIGTDILKNIITAEISNNAEIITTGDVKVKANSNIKDININNSTTVSTASKGIGAGLGVVVNVDNNTITSKVENSNITKSKSIDINSLSKEDSKFLGLNVGVQTSGGNMVDVNGIVNVLNNNVSTSVINSTLNSDGNVGVTANYDTAVQGITAIGSGSSTGSAFGGNVLVNVIKGTTEAIVDKKSKIAADGDVNITADTKEALNLNAISVTATASGTAALGGNVNANILNNTTETKVEGDIKKSKSVTIAATDLTDIKERSVSVAGSGGTAGVGGVVSVDVLNKTVKATTKNNTINSNGNVSVTAKSETGFGAKKNEQTGKYEELPIGSPEQIIAGADNDGIDKVAMLTDWQYNVDAAGGSSAGVSGSIVVKVVKNTIDAIVNNSEINSDGLNINADNYTITNAVIGNAAGGKTAAVGNSTFVNVVIGNTSAKLSSGSIITSDGDINVNAKDREIVRDVIVAAGGAGTASVNGAITVNVIDDNTNAIVESNATINKAGNVGISADKTTDIQSIDISAGVAGTAQVGGIFKLNKFDNYTNAKIGADNQKTTLNNVSGDISLSSNTEEAFSAMLLAAGGAGTASVNGIGVVNIVDSTTNSILNNSDINANSGKVDVTSTHSFNKGSGSKSADVLSFMKNKGDNVVSKDEIKQFSPTVMLLSGSGAGVASVSGNIVVNHVTSHTNAEIINSTVSTANGANANATQNIETFDAVAGISAAGTVAVSANGVANVIDNTTTAKVENVTATNGGASATASDVLNLNIAEFSAGGSGVATVLIGVDTNVLENDVNAYIKNSVINGNTTVSALNDITQNSIFAAIGGAGTGAVLVAPTVNSFIGNANAYIDNSRLSNGQNSISATTNYETGNMVAGASGAGIGAAVNTFAIVNTLSNNTNAYINNTTITNAISTNVSANSNAKMYSLIGSLAVSGVGASVLPNGIVNVYNNRLNSYIANSDITGGNVNINSESATTQKSISGSVAGNGIGAGISVNGLVNVFKNEVTSDLISTSANNVENVDVKAKTTQNLDNENYGLTISGGAAVSANALVNVINNITKAYINPVDKNISATGKISINADDTILLKNVIGVISAGGVAAAANVNVNVINNDVISQLLSSTDASEIQAGSLEVISNSTIGETNSVNSVAGGIGGVAANVIVNSIGGKVNTAGSPDAKTQLDDAITSANKTLEKLGRNSIDSMSKPDGTGTLAEISTNITTKDNIKVQATNTVKGYDNDTFSSINRVAAAGIGAGSVGVHVTNMKYKTVADISNGNVVSTAGDIDVIANNKIKANTDIISAAGGVYSIQGGVSVFNNTALTKALIDGANVSVGDNLNIKTSSDSSITSNAIAAVAGVAGVGVNVAIANDNSTTSSKITGENVDISAGKINIQTEIASAVAAELQAGSVAGLDIKAVVNKSTVNTISDAVISATGNIKTDELQLALINKGISAKDTYYAGSVSLLSAGAESQGAFVTSKFNTGINSSDINISGKTSDFVDKVNIYSGVDSQDTLNVGNINSEIIAKRGSVSVLNVTPVFQTADVSVTSNTDIQTGSGTLKTNDMNVASKLKRETSIGSTSGSISGVSVGITKAVSTISGENNINFSGNNIIKNKANVTLNDDSTTTNNFASKSISIVGVGVNNFASTINTNTNVNLGGNISTTQMDVDSNVNRNAYSSMGSSSIGLVKVDKINLDTESSGNSLINVSLTNPDNTYENTFNLHSNLSNLVESELSSNSKALAGIAKGSTVNKLDTKNLINFNNSNINSTGDINATVNSINDSIRKEIADAGGVVMITGSEVKNVIDNQTGITVENSTINANNVNLTSDLKWGSEAGQGVTYKGSSDGFAVNDYTRVANSIKQTNNIDVKNSKISAFNEFVSNLDTDSKYEQIVSVDNGGFVAKGSPKSTISMSNYNTFTNDANSVISADVISINMNSSNNLYSRAEADLRGMGTGTDSNGPTSIIDLTVTNNVNNSGHMLAESLAEINYMTNSNNTLNQSSYLYTEAGVATGSVAGSIDYKVNNELNIPLGATIESGHNVIANFTNGKNNLNSSLYAKKVSRILFGIPITDTESYSRVNQISNYKMQLDGDIIAAKSSQKYMKIDNDGNIVERTGFSTKDYTYKHQGDKIDGQAYTADTIAKLNENLKTLEKEAIDLQNAKTNAEEELAKYQVIYDDCSAKLKEGYFVTDTEILITIKGSVVGDVTKDSRKISEAQFNDIINASKGKTFDELKTYINNNKSFSQDQKNYVISSITNETAKILPGDEEKTYYVYNGRVVTSQSSLETMIANFNTQKDAAKTKIDYYTNQLETLGKNITLVNQNINTDKQAIVYYQENPFDDFVIEKSSIMFNSFLNQDTSKIELNGINNDAITGNGNFKVAPSQFLIENYSNADLVFNGIDTTDNLAGLFINGRDFGDHINKPDMNVNCYKILGKEIHTTDGSGVHYLKADNIDLSQKNSDIAGGDFVIYNYFDLNDVMIDRDKYFLASNITFNDIIRTASNITILNESGDITFNEAIITNDNSSKNIIATLGDVNFNTPNADLKFSGDDRLFAGRNINIKANSLDSDITIAAGYSERNLTITDDMLSEENLVVDPSTGIKNMINTMNSSEISVYLQDKNNIKALYQDGKIYVFDINQDGGNVNIDINNTANGGKIVTTSGYAKIKIVNNTSKDLVINGLENTYRNGYLNNDKLMSGKNPLSVYDKALTEIISNNSNVELAGIILNGYKNDVEVGSGELKVNAKSIIIDNLISDELQRNILDVTGNTSLTSIDGTVINGAVLSRQGDINILNTNNNGIILNNAAKLISNGNVSITNDGQDGINSTAIISTDKGDVTIQNNNGGIKLNKDAQVISSDGNVSITNDGQDGINSTAIISTDKGDVTIQNNNGGIKLNKDAQVLSSDGNISITNDGQNGINSTATISTDKGDVTIQNNNGGIKLNKDAQVISSDGNILVLNKGQKGINSAATISTDKGDIKISNIGEAGTTVSGTVNTDNGNISITNDGQDGINSTAIVSTDKGNVTIQNNNGGIKLIKNAQVISSDGNILVLNKGQKGINSAATISTNKGDIKISNIGAAGTTVSGTVNTDNGNIDIDNEHSGITISGKINTDDGNIGISNNNIDNNNSDIVIKGLVNTNLGNISMNNENSDIIIGSAENSYNHISANSGNVIINQVNGNILNGVIKSSKKLMANDDLGNQNQFYKTLIFANGDLVIDVKDGDVGINSSNLANYLVDADIRDFRDTINVNVSGDVNINVINDKKSDNRLVNLRARYSDLHIKNITSDGDIILTAADWKYADERPTPDNIKYFKGYSILNTADDNKSPITGKNVSFVASDTIGTPSKIFKYIHDAKSLLGAEAENDINMMIQSNTQEDVRFNQFISKNGGVDIKLNNDAVINGIMAGKDIKIIDIGKNLTIEYIGPYSKETDINDILLPHDDILSKTDVMPETVDISVLDAFGGDNSNSTLTIYNAYVKGANKGQGAYGDSGKRLADVKLMADNIFATSKNAPISSVKTLKHLNGYVPKPDTEKEAVGFIATGDGNSLVFDITGVSPDFVNSNTNSANRTKFNGQLEDNNYGKFYNSKSLLTGEGYRVDNLAVSVNSEPNLSRGVIFNKLYANDAYVDTLQPNLAVNDGYIVNYAEFTSGNYNEKYLKTIVDNNYRRLINPDYVQAQLFTQKTGSFALNMDETINISTTAPVVHNEPHHTVNNYGTENTFTSIAFKEDAIQEHFVSEKLKNQGNDKKTDLKNDIVRDNKFRTFLDEALKSNVDIVEISKNGATIYNTENLKVGDTKEIALKFTDSNIDVKVNAKVIYTEFDKAYVKFVDMPADVANQITYRYMQRVSSAK